MDKMADRIRAYLQQPTTTDMPTMSQTANELDRLQSLADELAAALILVDEAIKSKADKDMGMIEWQLIVGKAHHVVRAALAKYDEAKS